MSNKHKLKYNVDELKEIIEELLFLFNIETTVNDLVINYRKEHQPALLKPKNNDRTR